MFPSLSEFPRFIVVHTVKGFGIVNKAEIDAGQRLIEFCQENALVIANTLFQQHKRRLYTWTSQDGQHRNQIDYILCGQRWRSSIQSAKTRLGADCGSDHELLIAKFRLKLKKVGKATRPFRYDLNHPLWLSSLLTGNLYLLIFPVVALGLSYTSLINGVLSSNNTPFNTGTP